MRLVPTYGSAPHADTLRRYGAYLARCCRLRTMTLCRRSLVRA